MSGALQAVYQNLRGFSTVPVIGSAYEGGYFAGQISTAGNGIADYNLVAAPKSTGENNNLVQKTSNTTTAGTSSVIDGPTNSANMNDVLHPAAQFCEGLTIGGYSDWYLPAKNELEVCYYNLKPSTTSNSTGSGANTYAVPSRSGNYSSGTPAQTSATDFQSGGTQAFVSTFPSTYWSSTQSAAPKAWEQAFNNGTQYGQYKNNQYNVRAIRRVAI